MHKVIIQGSVMAVKVIDIETDMETDMAKIITSLLQRLQVGMQRGSISPLI